MSWPFGVQTYLSSAEHGSHVRDADAGQSGESTKSVRARASFMLSKRKMTPHYGGPAKSPSALVVLITTYLSSSCSN